VKAILSPSSTTAEECHRVSGGEWRTHDLRMAPNESDEAEQKRRSHTWEAEGGSLPGFRLDWCAASKDWNRMPSLALTGEVIAVTQLGRRDFIWEKAPWALGQLFCQIPQPSADWLGGFYNTRVNAVGGAAKNFELDSGVKWAQTSFRMNNKMGRLVQTRYWLFIRCPPNERILLQYLTNPQNCVQYYLIKFYKIKKYFFK